MSKTQTKIETQVAQPEEQTITTSKPERTLTLKLEEKPRVTWSEDTIDNEHMNKLKSNCN